MTPATAEAPRRSLGEWWRKRCAEDEHLLATHTQEEYQALLGEAEEAYHAELPWLKLQGFLEHVQPTASSEDLAQAMAAVRSEAEPGERDLIAVLQRIARRQVARAARIQRRGTPAPVVAFPSTPSATPRARQSRSVRRARPAPSGDDDSSASPRAAGSAAASAVVMPFPPDPSATARLDMRAQERSERAATCGGEVAELSPALARFLDWLADEAFDEAVKRCT